MLLLVGGGDGSISTRGRRTPPMLEQSCRAVPGSIPIAHSVMAIVYEHKCLPDRHKYNQVATNEIRQDSTRVLRPSGHRPRPQSPSEGAAWKAMRRVPGSRPDAFAKAPTRGPWWFGGI